MCGSLLRPRGLRDRVPYGERFRQLGEIWPVLAVFLLVIGGIYTGIFTPTEAAAIGAAGTGLIALVSRSLSLNGLSEAILATASATAMIFLIVLGAAALNRFLALSQLPQFVAAWVTEQGFNPWMVLAIVLIFYLIMGCVMDSLSMILLTVPIVFPLMMALDFGMAPDDFAIWFGILDPDRRGGGADHATGGDEPVHHQLHVARRPGFPRHSAVLCRLLRVTSSAR